MVNLYLHMAPFSAFMQKERWRVSQLKGKYAARLPMLIQAIWLKGTLKKYVNKKLMLLMALAKLKKSISWVQITFNFLHFRLQDLFVIVKLKKENSGKEMEFDATQVIDIIL